MGKNIIISINSLLEVLLYHCSRQSYRNSNNKGKGNG